MELMLFYRHRVGSHFGLRLVDTVVHTHGPRPVDPAMQADTFDINKGARVRHQVLAKPGRVQFSESSTARGRAGPSENITVLSLGSGLPCSLSRREPQDRQDGQDGKEKRIFLQRTLFGVDSKKSSTRKPSAASKARAQTAQMQERIQPPHRVHNNDTESERGVI